MWPFKKKVVKVEEPKKQFRIVFKEEVFELGKTKIKYRFKDGRELYSLCYGSFWQDSDYGEHPKFKAWVSPPSITSSLVVAQSLIQNTHGGHISTFVDDIKNPKCTVMGDPIAVQIVETYPYEETFNVAYLEEVK